MGMIVKVVDAPAVAGGKAIFLCDENGVSLPTQISASVRNEVGDYPIIDVSLMIDGDKVRFE